MSAAITRIALERAYLVRVRYRGPGNCRGSAFVVSRPAGQDWGRLTVPYDHGENADTNAERAAVRFVEAHTEGEVTITPLPDTGGDRLYLVRQVGAATGGD